MKSRITIELDFGNNNTPVIQILHSDSDDVRDKLISNFAEMLGGSSWCQIKWLDSANIDSRALGLPDRIHITPIHPAKFKEQAALMLEQDRLNKEFGVEP